MLKVWRNVNAPEEFANDVYRETMKHRQSKRNSVLPLTPNRLEQRRSKRTKTSKLPPHRKPA